MTFSVDESGYVVANHPDGSPIENNNCIFAANKVTAINRSQISVDKQDIADSAELAGAIIKITRTDGSLNADVLEVKRGETSLTKADSLEDNADTAVYKTSDTITFVSDGKTRLTSSVCRTANISWKKSLHRTATIR